MSAPHRGRQPNRPVRLMRLPLYFFPLSLHSIFIFCSYQNALGSTWHARFSGVGVETLFSVIGQVRIIIDSWKWSLGLSYCFLWAVKLVASRQAAAKLMVGATIQWHPKRTCTRRETWIGRHYVCKRHFQSRFCIFHRNKGKIALEAIHQVYGFLRTFPFYFSPPAYHNKEGAKGCGWIESITMLSISPGE